MQSALVKEVTSRDWSVGAGPSVRDQPPSIDALTAFTEKRLGIDWEEVGDERIVGICAARFLDLAHDGKYRLLVSTDSSGRAICNQLYVFSQNSGAQDINAWGITDDATLDSIIHNDKGITKLIIPGLWFTPAGMGDCAALWTRVYSWNGRALSDISATNRSIYQDRLAVLTKLIDAAPSHDEHDILERSCSIMERDRIVRFLGGPPETGLDSAEEWMRSDNWRLRKNAAATLETINVPRAKGDLKVLARDSDGGVAFTASLALQHRIAR
jgi:hypothetical protein